MIVRGLSKLFCFVFDVRVGALTPGVVSHRGTGGGGESKEEQMKTARTRDESRVALSTTHLHTDTRIRHTSDTHQTHMRHSLSGRDAPITNATLINSLFKLGVEKKAKQQQKMRFALRKGRVAGGVTARAAR